jgi:HSP20 family protein
MLRFLVAFARWDPLQDLVALHERMNRLAGLDAPGWVPPVDIYEAPDRYAITAELPGLARDDFQIHIQDGKLTLRGQRPTASACCEQYHRVERGHGAFSRTFVLPLPVDADAVSAELSDGVLTVVVPKLGASVRKIEIG